MPSNKKKASRKKAKAKAKQAATTSSTTTPSPPAAAAAAADKLPGSSTPEALVWSCFERTRVQDGHGTPVRREALIDAFEDKLVPLCDIVVVGEGGAVGFRSRHMQAALRACLSTMREKGWAVSRATPPSDLTSHRLGLQARAP